MLDLIVKLVSLVVHRLSFRRWLEYATVQVRLEEHFRVVALLESEKSLDRRIPNTLPIECIGEQ